MKKIYNLESFCAEIEEFCQKNAVKENEGGFIYGFFKILIE